jgi:HTH-type transcriptional regulator/antitoxin HigA
MAWMKMIKNDEEYRQALVELDAVMDAEPGEEAFERLELLTLVVKTYEDKAYPIAPPSPVEAIKFAAESRGLGSRDLAAYFGGRSALSQVLNGKRDLTLGMIRALHKGLGIPADTLIQVPGASLPAVEEGVDFKRFPLARMISRGWLPAVANARDRAEELVRGFAAAAGDTVYGHAGCFRQGSRQNAKDDRYAVEAWRLGARIEAAKVGLEATFDAASVDADLLRAVATISARGTDAPLQARDYLAALGIRLICVPHLSRTYLDGGVFHLPDGPVIALTLRHDRIDYFWFTLLHDLAHLARGDVHPDSDCLIEDLELAPDDDRERQADQMAADAAIPRHLWAEHPVSRGRTPSPHKIYDLAATAGVHPAIVAGRVRHERNNYRILSSLIGQGAVRHLFVPPAASE